MSSTILTRTAVLATAAIAWIVSLGCGGGGGEPSIELDALAAIAAEVDVPGTSLGERTSTDKEMLWEGLQDTEHTDGWVGEYREEFVDVQPGIERIIIFVDVYDSEDAAQDRSEAEPRLVQEFLFDSLSPSVVVERFDIDLGDGSCGAFSIKFPAIIPQYEVYCSAGTTAVFARTIGTDEGAATELAQRLAADLTSAIQDAPPPTSQ
jgi:hypothetical protein